MPITEDIMDHGIIGPRIREGIAIGREQRLIEARAQGRLEGELQVLTDLIAHRFGTSQPSVMERLYGLLSKQLRNVALQIAAAESVDDLFD